MATIKRRAWREGALTWINGGNFSMNPYAPHPNPTNSWYRTWQEEAQNLAWTAGYWWAVEHRPREEKTDG